MVADLDRRCYAFAVDAVVVGVSSSSARTPRRRCSPASSPCSRPWSAWSPPTPPCWAPVVGPPGSPCSGSASCPRRRSSDRLQSRPAAHPRARGRGRPVRPRAGRAGLDRGRRPGAPAPWLARPSRRLGGRGGATGAAEHAGRGPAAGREPHRGAPRARPSYDGNACPSRHRVRRTAVDRAAGEPRGLASTPASRSTVDGVVRIGGSRVEVAADGALVVTDRGSPGGTVLIRCGVARRLGVDRPATRLEGDEITIGDRALTVVRVGLNAPPAGREPGVGSDHGVLCEG